MAEAPKSCPFCARTVAPHARFCGGCGRSLAISSTGQTIPQATAQLGTPTHGLDDLAPAPDTPLGPGVALGPGGRYRIERVLGQGGFGTAMLARDTRLDRPCVVKQLALDASWDAASRAAAIASFRREARLLVALNTPGHPNIPEIYDFLEAQACLVMKYVPGRSLEQILEARGPLPAQDALRHVRDVCAALAYMHGHGGRPVLHRDVKPSNILLDETGRIWLIDFGLAKAQGAPLPVAPLPAAPDGPDTSQLAGTLGYTPPEQWQGHAEPRSDIFALGATLHRLLTGYTPARTELMALVRGTYQPPPLQRFDSELPAALDRLVRQTMAPKPADRPDAAELLAALESRLSRPAVPPPPEPTRPPALDGFVGRRRELEELERQIAREHVAVITGPPGVGKSALAATLARRFGDPNKIFWHSFQPGEDARALIWELAAFLAWHGQDELWRQLQVAGQGGALPPLSVLGDYAVQLLRGQGYMLCLDDLHHAEGEAEVGRLVGQLRAEADAGATLLIVASRTSPSLAPAGPPLGGLSDAESAELLAQRGIALPPALAAELYARTEGNAQLLMLALEGLRRGGDPARLIASLATSASVEQYLLRTVDAGLSDTERGVLRAVSALLGHPAGRDLVETLLDGTAARRPLAALAARHLLTANDGEGDRTYTLHATLREFYYAELGRAERKELHRRAGVFFAEIDPDAIEAARHFALAGETVRAARLAVAEVGFHISAGRGPVLRDLLDRLAADDFTDDLRAEVALARGELAWLTGDAAAARARYGEALAVIDAHPDHPEFRGPAARACLGMAATIEYDVPEQALGWLEQALARGEGAPDTEQAAVRIKQGAVLNALGRSAEALAASQTGEALLPPGPSALRVRALLTLSTIYSSRGDMERGSALGREGVAICEQLGDNLGLGEHLSNLGADKIFLGDWPAAIADFDRARAIAERLGNRRLRAIVDVNLGYLRVRTGEHAQAQQQLDEGITLARAASMQTVELAARATMVDLRLRQGDLPAAAFALDQADALAALAGATGYAPELGRLRAELALAQGDANDAIARAEQAAALAEEQHNEVEMGVAFAVAARALASQGRVEEAYDQFSRAVEHLDHVDRYEAARARMAWATTLPQLDPALTRSLLEEARAGFGRLGAAAELAAATDRLAQA